jgi:mannosyltransferase
MSSQSISVTLDGIVFGLQAYGGISNYWGRLLRHMDALKNIHNNVVLPKLLKCAEYDSNWHANSTCKRELVPTSVSRYLDVRDDRSSEVFHSSYFRVPTNTSAKYVVTVYDFIYERYESGPARWVHSWQKLRSIRRADAVICISKATRDDVLRYAPEVDPSRVHVVYLGVDQSTFYPDLELERNTSKMEKMVLYVGQRGGHKRFDLAVDSVAKCRDLSLGIVGPDPTKLEINLLNSQLLGRWHSFGTVSSSQLRELYSTAFAFIYPSDYEGFGLPILEAMACGCPVLAAHTASLPEVGGVAAIYALRQDPEMFAAALTQLQSSANARQDLISAGLRQAKKFTWERTFSETLSIYLGEPVSARND